MLYLGYSTCLMPADVIFQSVSELLTKIKQHARRTIASKVFCVAFKKNQKCKCVFKGNLILKHILLGWLVG